MAKEFHPFKDMNGVFCGNPGCVIKAFAIDPGPGKGRGKDVAQSTAENDAGRA